MMETRSRKRMRLDVIPGATMDENEYLPNKKFMWTSSTQDTQETMTQAMSIDLILKEVFTNLPRSDLLQASLVSQKWNLIARSVIREGSRCLAVISLDSDQALCKLKALLLTSFNLPFNGVMFRLHQHRSKCLDENPTELERLDSIPWELLKLRRVSIVDEKFHTWCSHSMHSVRCHSILMLHKVWPSVAINVEHLSIRSISFSLKFKHPDGTLICPNVRTIEWPTADINEPYFESVFTSTPKLVELTNDVSQYSLPFVTRHGKPGVVKRLRVFDAQHSTVINFAKERPALQKVSFSHCHYVSDFNPEILSQVLYGLLTNSVKELKMNYPEMLFYYHICKSPLVNLSHLTVAYSNQCDDRYGFQHMNFGKIFPNVKSVTFQPGCKPCRPPNAVRTEFLEVPEGGIATASGNTVTRLEYWNSGGIYDRVHNYMEPNLIRALERVFPNVKYFVMGGYAWNLDLDLIFSTVWTVWKELERIKFVSAGNDTLAVMEAGIIGVSTQELSHWKTLAITQGVDMREMQFVPYQPSIRDASNLKTFCIFVPLRYSVFGMDYPTYVRVGAPAPSVRQVFPWASPLALERLPSLAVEISVYKSR
ncbi:unnamed protein product [Allacma fusca]|uniref:F-box domain-containing protein n=1 Tax=Allacma fusca TaxID=39272 RepID=A0A8J2J9B9_9HEXA|nr:unnamed protein product [Allacma fusca]